MTAKSICFTITSLCSLTFAQCASAATFVFDVTVTSRDGGSGTFQPFTFQQSWQLAIPPSEGGISTISAGSGLYATITKSGFVSASATPSASPTRDDLVTLAGPLTTISSELVASETFRQYPGFGFSTTDYGLSLSSLGQYYLNDGNNIISSMYQLNLAVQNGSEQEAAFRSLTKFDAAGLAQVLAAGPLTYSEAGERLTGPARGGLPVEARTTYQGTATFRQLLPDVVSPVPEPASWLTMLLGFALLGGSLRRRSGRPSRVLAPVSPDGFERLLKPRRNAPAANAI